MDADRRRRINLYKKIIVAFVLVSILVPLLLCIVLFVQVRTLEQEVSSLYSLREEYLSSIEKLNTSLKEHEEAYKVLDPDYAEAQNQVDKVDSDIDKKMQSMEPENEEASESTPAQEMETTLATAEEETTTMSVTTETEEQVVREYKGTVYLTFDDGPSANTNAILDILKEYGATATFFVNAKKEEYYGDEYKRIVAEGHTLAMHSYTHQYDDVYASREAFIEDTLKLQDYLYRLTGVKSDIYRFPGGSSTTTTDSIREFARALDEMGIVYFDWNVSSGDATSPILSADEIYGNVISGIENRDISVVLMHDLQSKTTTVEALPQILEYLIENNYEVTTLDDSVTPVQHVKLDK